MTSFFDKLTSNRQDDTTMSNNEPANAANPDNVAPTEHNTTASNSSLKPVNNQFTKLLTLTKYLPANVRAKILSTAFGKIVPFVGTAGIYYETVSPNKVVVSLDNDKKVQNHIGSVHAVAVTLLAETATGFILGLNLPSDRVLLVKSYNVNFYRPLKKGQVAAVATLTDEQRLHILNTAKGEMVIPCYIEDRSTQQQEQQKDPITVEMTWAWIAKDELKQRRAGQRKSADTPAEASTNQNQTTDTPNSTTKTSAANTEQQKTEKQKIDEQTATTTADSSAADATSDNAPKPDTH